MQSNAQCLKIEHEEIEDCGLAANVLSVFSGFLYETHKYIFTYLAIMGKNFCHAVEIYMEKTQ